MMPNDDKCPQCTNPYNNGIFKMNLLTECGHSICLSCLKRDKNLGNATGFSCYLEECGVLTKYNDIVPIDKHLKQRQAPTINENAIINEEEQPPYNPEYIASPIHEPHRYSMIERCIRTRPVVVPKVKSRSRSITAPETKSLYPDLNDYRLPSATDLVQDTHICKTVVSEIFRFCGYSECSLPYTFKEISKLSVNHVKNLVACLDKGHGAIQIFKVSNDYKTCKFDLMFKSEGAIDITWDGSNLVVLNRFDTLKLYDGNGNLKVEKKLKKSLISIKKAGLGIIGLGENYLQYFKSGSLEKHRSIRHNSTSATVDKLLGKKQELLPRLENLIDICVDTSRYVYVLTQNKIVQLNGDDKAIGEIAITRLTGQFVDIYKRKQLFIADKRSTISRITVDNRVGRHNNNCCSKLYPVLDFIGEDLQIRGFCVDDYRDVLIVSVGRKRFCEIRFYSLKNAFL